MINYSAAVARGFITFILTGNLKRRLSVSGSRKSNYKTLVTVIHIGIPYNRTKHILIYIPV